MYEEHERLGAVPSCDIVELDPIGCHILMTTKTTIQQTIWWNCKINRSVYRCVQHLKGCGQRVRQPRLSYYPFSLAGQPLHMRGRVWGHAYTIYTTCSAAARSAAPIRLLHVIFKSYCGWVPQARMPTNQALDLHVAAVRTVYYIAKNVQSLRRIA